MKLPHLLKTFLIQSALWTGLCLVTELVCGLMLHWSYPYNYPAVPYTAVFGDFRYFVAKFTFLHSKTFFDGPVLSYPAPAVLLYRPFMLGLHVRLSTAFFIAFVLLTFFCAAVLFRNSLIQRGLAPASALLFVSFALLSFPFWFELHQGNIEAVVWIFTSLGLCAFWSGRSWYAAILLGCAVAMKLFPIIFLALFLPKRMYRQFVSAVAVAGIATLASLWILCPDIGYSWHATLVAMNALQSYLLSSRSISMGFDHGMLSLIKICLPVALPAAALQATIRVYLILTAFAGLALYALRIRHLPLANQMICLSVASVLFPPVSFDYTLLHLCTPLALYTYAVLDARREERDCPPRGLTPAMALLAFLLSFQSEIIWHGVRVAGQCKALALLALLVLALRFPLSLAPRLSKDRSANRGDHLAAV